MQKKGGGNSIFKKWDTKRFLLQEKLGEGSFGVVYKALDVVNKKIVVVKIVEKQIDVKNEIQILEIMKNKCAAFVLCTTGEYFEDESYYFLIVEWLDNYIPLVDIMGSIGEDGKRLFKIIVNLIVGLHVLHFHNIIHRDIKPTNIMIEKNGTRIKYIDFGLSCFRNDCEKINDEWVGTLPYIAPEMIEGQIHLNSLEVLKKIDIWALGIVLYELIVNTGVGLMTMWDKKFVNKYKFIRDRYDLTNEEDMRYIFLGFDYNDLTDLMHEENRLIEMRLREIFDHNYILQVVYALTKKLPEPKNVKMLSLRGMLQNDPKIRSLPKFF